MAKILAADDSPIIRKLVGRVLTSAGHSVTTVEDGDEAIAEAHRTEYDLLILDLHMPRMNGLEALRRLRKTRTYYRTPILVFTADHRDAVRKQVKAAGANARIHKPPRPAQLIGIVQKLLDLGQ